MKHRESQQPGDASSVNTAHSNAGGGASAHPVTRDDVRASYDAVADDYAEHFHDELSHKPLDRALLQMIVDEVGPDAPVADLGCGPGHVTGWLAARGVHAVGIDLSPRMVDVARRTHPTAEFRTGDMLQLPAADQEFAAAVTLYAIIHLVPGEIDTAFAEMHRVLRRNALLLVAFHAGDEVRHREEWFGATVNLDFRLLGVDTVCTALEGAGLSVEARLVRRSYPHEVETRRGYVLARSPEPPSAAQR